MKATELLRPVGSVAAMLVFIGCAPTLSSQVTDVASHAQVKQLAPLREGTVEPEGAASALELLKHAVDADTAVRIALLNNRGLRAQLRELGVSSGRLITAGLVANPTVEFELLPERDSHYELRVEYELTSLLVAPLRRGAAEADLEAAKLSAASAVLQLGYEVRTRFYALQAAEQRLALARQTLDALAAARDTSEALVEAGNARQLDLASEIAAYERARISVASMELETSERREELQRLLGLHGEQTDWRIAGPLPEAPDALATPDTVERAALEANLDLRASQRRLDALAKQTGVVRTEGWLPAVAADVHALRVKDDVERAGDAWRWGAGVSVQVPMFDRGQGELRTLEAKFDAALERYQGLAIDVRSGAREARNRAVSSYARAHQYQTVIRPAQRVVLEQTLLQYNAMQVGIFELLAARRELLDVELTYVDALRDFWSSQAEMEALLRGRLVRSVVTDQSTSLEGFNLRQEGH